jgi:hypothetical protein
VTCADEVLGKGKVDGNAESTSGFETVRLIEE